MNITSTLYRLARLSADLRAGYKAGETGSPMPIVRRIFNKFVGRKLISKLIWRK